MIGMHDAWIAATALACDLALATAHRRHCDRIDDLIVESWQRVGLIAAGAFAP